LLQRVAQANGPERRAVRCEQRPDSAKGHLQTVVKAADRA